MLRGREEGLGCAREGWPAVAVTRRRSDGRAPSPSGEARHRSEWGTQVRGGQERAVLSEEGREGNVSIRVAGGRRPRV